MKRIRVLALFAALFGSLLWQACALPGGNYTAPIVSLTTKAPIPAIKTAFAKAFGDTAQIEVAPDGKAYLTLENYHMSIKVFGRTYEANVMTIEGAEVVSEKREAFSDSRAKTIRRDIGCLQCRERRCKGIDKRVKL